MYCLFEILRRTGWRFLEPCIDLGKRQRAVVFSRDVPEFGWVPVCFLLRQSTNAAAHLLKQTLLSRLQSRLQSSSIDINSG